MERIIPKREPVDLTTLFSGLIFIGRNKVVLGAILLDLFAVLLGSATALLPIFARDIFSAGPLGFGAMRASPAVGAIAAALVLTRRPITRRVGHAMFGAVAAYAMGTILLALSPSFALALGALFVVGAADTISMVIRQTLVQLHTPDQMRGRVFAVEFDVHLDVEPARHLPRRHGRGDLRRRSGGAAWRLEHYRGRADFGRCFSRAFSRRGLRTGQAKRLGCSARPPHWPRQHMASYWCPNRRFDSIWQDIEEQHATAHPSIALAGHCARPDDGPGRGGRAVRRRFLRPGCAGSSRRRLRRRVFPSARFNRRSTG